MKTKPTALLLGALLCLSAINAGNAAENPTAIGKIGGNKVTRLTSTEMTKAQGKWMVWRTLAHPYGVNAARAHASYLRYVRGFSSSVVIRGFYVEVHIPDSQMGRYYR